MFGLDGRGNPMFGPASRVRPGRGPRGRPGDAAGPARLAPPGRIARANPPEAGRPRRPLDYSSFRTASKCATSPSRSKKIGLVSAKTGIPG